MAAPYKRGNVWWGRAQRGGKEFRKSLGTSDRRTAEKRLRQWLDDMDAIAWGDKPPRPWADVWQRFMREHFPTLKPASAKRYAVSLKNLSLVMDGKTIQQVGSSLLSEFETMRRSAGATAPTIRRDFACLSVVMSYCEDWEWIEPGANIVPAYMRKRRRFGLKESPGKTRYLTEDEEARLIEAANEPSRTAIILAIDTGLRDQELMSLKWDQVDFRNGVVRTTTDTKSRRARVVPLPARSAQKLAQRPRHITSPFVFCHDDGKRYARLNQGLKGAWGRAGIAKTTFHDLRRTAGCRWLQRDGMSIAEVGGLLGHSSVAVTEKSYAFLDLEATAQKAAQDKRIAK